MLSNQNPHQGPSVPCRIAQRIGDCARAALTIIAWAVVLAGALAAGYMVVRALLFLIELAHRALGL